MNLMEVSSDRWLIAIATAMIGGLYIYNLSTPFDFVDDGAISHSIVFTGISDWLGSAWDTIIFDYHNRGTFLPTTWTLWRFEATVLGPHPALWRAVAIAWCMASAYLLLEFMLELRIALYAAIAATAFAIWNGHRIGIWTNLASPEAVAMPFALLALIAAARANKSSRPVFLDFSGMFCVLVALGCKNTFVAIVPAQVFLRMSANEEGLVEGIRQRWRPGLLLSLTIAWPAIHFLHFRENWHPGQYIVPGPSLRALSSIIEGWRRGFLTPITIPALAISLIAVFANRSSTEAVNEFFRRNRRGLIAATLVILGGLLVYLPMGSAAGGPGRYSIPAIFGFDIIFGMILSAVFCLSASKLRSRAITTIVCCLIVAAAYAVAMQDRFSARVNVLAHLLNELKVTAPPGLRVLWPGEYSDLPTLGEGIHLRWHLQQMGRSDIRFTYVAEGDRPNFEDLTTSDMIVGMSPEANLRRDWSAQTFRTTYWLGQKEFRFEVWRPNK